METEGDDRELKDRALELEEIEEEERQMLVREALGKFNVFLHLTAFLAGSAYLVLLGIFVPEALPYIFIPIGLWAFGLAYHFWRAWHPRDKTAKQAISKLDEKVFVPERQISEEEQERYEEGLKVFEDDLETKTTAPRQATVDDSTSTLQDPAAGATSPNGQPGAEGSSEQEEP